MSVTIAPKKPVAPKKAKLKPAAGTRTAPLRHISKPAQTLIDKLQKQLNDKTTGSFSLSFQESKPHGSTFPWRSTVVGVTAVDKLQHGDKKDGRAMKAYVMVRITGRGLKSNPDGVPTKRVPARGVKPVTVRTLADIEKIMKDGPKEAKAAWAKRHPHA